MSDRISSIDLLAYGHLKTILINSSQSKEKEHLVKTYPDLIAYIKLLDFFVQNWAGLNDEDENVVDVQNSDHG